MFDLIYIVASKPKRGLPGIAKTADHKFYFKYRDACDALGNMPQDIKEYFAVFAVVAEVRMEATSEVSI